jgi:biopolymer transport protein ExbB/TolQ
METYTTIVNFFKDGGIFMIPIAFVLALGTAIAIERYIYLSAARRTNRKLLAELLPILKQGDFKKAYGLTSKKNNAMSRVINNGLSKVKSAKHRDDVEMSIEEGMMEIIPRLEKRTHYLATFANIATLLGLLGTIMGLIKAFDSVADADPSQKAQILSGSISIAMNTTAFGLMVAIPLLLIYTVLQTKTTEIVDSLEMAGTKFVNSIFDKTSFGDK